MANLDKNISEASMWNFFSKIETCNTWACVNSFAAWASTLLTILISGSALIISILAYRYAKRKDIETLSISIGTCLLATPPQAQNAFFFQVVNIGHRSATLKDYAWIAHLPFSKKSMLINYFIDNSFTKLSEPFPTVLKDGDEAKYFAGLDIFSHHPTFLYHHSRLKAWLLINSLRICVTTTRQTHYQRLPRSVRKLIWLFYRQDVLNHNWNVAT